MMLGTEEWCNTRVQRTDSSSQSRDFRNVKLLSYIDLYIYQYTSVCLIAHLLPYTALCRPIYSNAGHQVSRAHALSYVRLAIIQQGALLDHCRRFIWHLHTYRVSVPAMLRLPGCLRAHNQATLHKARSKKRARSWHH